MIWVASLLGVVIIAVSIVWFGLLWRMYSLRHDFEIAARSPQLVILTGFSCYVMSTAVLLQWLLLNAGTSLPCWVVFVISYSSEMPLWWWGLLGGEAYSCVDFPESIVAKPKRILQTGEMLCSDCILQQSVYFCYTAVVESPYCMSPCGTAVRK